MSPRAGPSKKRQLAYYVTGHGYGHATRVVEVCRALLDRGHHVIVCTCASPQIFLRDLPDLEIREIEPLDVGGVQRDALR
jgi:L-arabinokinase